MTAKILVIEDDIDSAELMRFQLEQAGYFVAIATDGTDGLRQTYAWQPDLILLDIMLPAMSGWTVCERLRQITEAPIIFISILSDEECVIRGLRIGADDYIVKPLAHDELLARIRAVLRRQAMGEESRLDTLFYDDLCIDFNRNTVIRGDEIIKLTPLESKLLACLAETPGKTLTHDHLMRLVWGGEKQARSSLKLYIWYLRRKLERDPSHPKIIVTDRGVGYRLRNPQV
jgi:two-component system KDP operon response regulator KdpE